MHIVLALRPFVFDIRLHAAVENLRLPLVPTKLGPSWPAADRRQRARTCSSIALALTIGCAFFAAAALATPSMAQTSTSFAGVSDYYGSVWCSATPLGNGTAASSASCPTTNATGGTGTASSSSDNASRSASASAVMHQTGADNSMAAYSTGESDQSSTIALLNGTGAGDNLVFHFLTTAQGSGSGGTHGSGSFWALFIVSDGNETYEAQDTYADGTTGAEYGNGQQTANGVDFTLPVSSFASSGGTLSYLFEINAHASVFEQPSGATLSSSISATLGGIDALDANDARVASATFNPEDGTATLDFTTTTPEPGSLALVGTGLIGLMPIVRRRKR